VDGDLVQISLSMLIFRQMSIEDDNYYLSPSVRVASY